MRYLASLAVIFVLVGLAFGQVSNDTANGPFGGLFFDPSDRVFSAYLSVPGRPAVDFPANWTGNVLNPAGLAICAHRPSINVLSCFISHNVQGVTAAALLAPEGANLTSNNQQVGTAPNGQPVLFFFPSPGNNPVVGQYNMNLQGLVNSTLEVLNSGQFSIALFTGGGGAGGGNSNTGNFAAAGLLVTRPLVVGTASATGITASIALSLNADGQTGEYYIVQNVAVNSPGMLHIFFGGSSATVGGNATAGNETAIDPPGSETFIMSAMPEVWTGMLRLPGGIISSIVGSSQTTTQLQNFAVILARLQLNGGPAAQDQANLQQLNAQNIANTLQMQLYYASSGSK